MVLKPAYFYVLTGQDASCREVLNGENSAGSDCNRSGALRYDARARHCVHDASFARRRADAWHT